MNKSPFGDDGVCLPGRSCRKILASWQVSATSRRKLPLGLLIHKVVQRITFCFALNRDDTHIRRNKKPAPREEGVKGGLAHSRRIINHERSLFTSCTLSRYLSSDGHKSGRQSPVSKHNWPKMFFLVLRQQALERFCFGLFASKNLLLAVRFAVQPPASSHKGKRHILNV